LFRSLIRATSTADTFSNRKAMLSLTPSERLLHVISFTNNYVAETHGDANMFATVFIGLINLQDGRLSYINCGNEPALLLKHGVVIDSLRPTGPVIGVIPDARFSVKEISMESRDLLLVFTDGIPDALNVDNVSFGNERMLKLLGGSQASPAQVLKNIENELLQFIGAAEQFDDITLLAVKRKA
jgi:sigma-B regulation protein RsbU (phosphoserine phosphatase)